MLTFSRNNVLRVTWVSLSSIKLTCSYLPRWPFPHLCLIFPSTDAHASLSHKIKLQSSEPKESAISWMSEVGGEIWGSYTFIRLSPNPVWSLYSHCYFKRYSALSKTTCKWPISTGKCAQHRSGSEKCKPKPQTHILIIQEITRRWWWHGEKRTLVCFPWELNWCGHDGIQYGSSSKN